MNKYSFSTFVTSFVVAASAIAVERGAIGVVNFSSCISDSKMGQKEQENMEAIHEQIASLIEQTAKELKELSAKSEDVEFVDSLSPKAVEELELKKLTLQEDMNRYQSQYSQVLQRAQYQVMQRVGADISKAAALVAESKGLGYVLNKEACFYIRPELDVTTAVIAEMDKAFDAAPAKKNISDNGEMSFGEPAAE